MNITVFSVEPQEVIGKDRIIKEELTVKFLIGKNAGCGLQAQIELFASERKRTAKEVADIIVKAVRDMTEDPAIYFNGCGFCGGEYFYGAPEDKTIKEMEAK